MGRVAHGVRIGDFNRLALGAQGTLIGTTIGVAMAHCTNARGTASHAG
jgi:hypothetical protein